MSAFDNGAPFVNEPKSPILAVVHVVSSIQHESGDNSVRTTPLLYFLRLSTSCACFAILRSSVRSISATRFCSERAGMQTLIVSIWGYFKFHVSEVMPWEFFLNSLIRLGLLKKAAKYPLLIGILGIRTVYAGLTIPSHGEMPFAPCHILMEL